MFKIIQFIVPFSICLIFWAFVEEKSSRYSKYEAYSANVPENIQDRGVEELLVSIGKRPALHFIGDLDLDSVKMGKELVYEGKLKDGSNQRVSKYFVCTDCHNQVKESFNPADEGPSAVLNYGMENNIPFLPASSFYGMYNKEHWYNGDYAKKYGSLVVSSRDSLYNAIQLCATQCSQGRFLEHWEVRSILHYMKTLEFKVSDLVFTAAEIKELKMQVDQRDIGLIDRIKSKYNRVNPATFGDSKIPEIKDYVPSFERGRYVFNSGCLHCHSTGRNITNFDMNDDKLTFRFLKNKKSKYNQFSISHITRYGTYAMSGRKQYMPQYSMEKMSDTQMLDLIHYVETKAEE